MNYLVSQTGRTKAYYLREIIEQGIDDIKDYYLAADVLQRVRKGQESVHSAADVSMMVQLGNQRVIYR